MRILLLFIIFMSGTSNFTMANIFGWESSSNRSIEFQSKAHFQSWQISDGRIGAETSITQLSIPVVAQIEISDRLSFDIIQWNAMSSFRRDSTNQELQSLPKVELEGLGDLSLKSSYYFSDNILLTAGLTLPIGEAKLDGNENMVSNALSDELLNFRIGRLSEGLGSNFGVSYAQTFFGATVSLGTNYLRKGNYQKPYLSSIAVNPDYNPGSEFSFTGGFGIDARPANLYSDLTYTIHTTETLDSKDYFKQGSTLRLSSGVALRRHRFSFELQGEWLWRDKNSYFYPNQNELELELRELNNYSFYSCSTAYKMGQRSTIRGFVENKHFTSDGRSEVANLFGYGLELNLKLFSLLELSFGLETSNGEQKGSRQELSGLGYYCLLTSGF